MIRLRGILDLLATHGGGEIRCWELESALARDGREVRSALRAEGIVRDGPRAETVPCDGPGCAREVRELPRGEDGRRRLFGVCTRDPAECESVEVGEHEVEQQIVSREAFAGALQRALKITPVPFAAPFPAGAESSEVVSLGHELAGGRSREVLLAWRPTSAAARAVIAERSGAEGALRVLTPDLLASLLTVRDGRIAELPRLHVVPAPAESNAGPELEPPAPAPPLAVPKRSLALDGLREITRWSDITLFDVDEDDLVGVTLDAHSHPRVRRLSCVDFGLARLRDRRPLDVFVLLKTICRGNGLFTTRAFGSSSNGKRLMSELRAAMRGTFGLEGDPFEKYSYRERSWKVKFRALAATPAELEAAMREVGTRPQVEDPRR